MRRINFLVLIIVLICVVNKVDAQGIVNNGASIVLANNPSVYIDGGSNGNYTNQNAGQIESDGTILLEGNWTNNGSSDVFTNIDNQGEVDFVGATAQIIGGSHQTNFENINVNNSGSDVVLDQNQLVSYNLTMTQGDLDLKDKTIDLGANGTLVNETVNRRIKSTDGSGIDGNGTGTIFATRNNPTGNVAGLGLSVNLGTNGNTTITRGHLVQSGTGTFSGNSSVFRYFEVSPVSNAGGGTSVTFNDCYTPELNGHNSSELIMYQWFEQNNSGIEYWHPLPDNNTGSTVPITQTLDLATLNYIKVTLGSKTTPLPVKLLSFKADCNAEYKNITWQTASEQNSDYFKLLVSEDGYNFKAINETQAAGISNQIISYNYKDYENYNTEVLYYKLVQFDFNNNSTEYNTTVQNCTETSGLDFVIQNNPATEYVKLRISSNKSEDLYLSFYNNIGQEMYKERVSMNQDSKIITVNIQNLSSGYYNLVLHSNTQIKTKRLLINK